VLENSEDISFKKEVSERRMGLSEEDKRNHPNFREMSNNDLLGHLLRFCPICGKELWGQESRGTRTEISPKDEVTVEVTSGQRFCEKCNVIYTFDPGTISFKFVFLKPPR